ncbi:hypothetical protein DPMN_191078 [Dreissena polymorpha]|uniref:Uncharacterized protein n=1 Tax=Dreissena polymorpha TaxID=45954 RepID=A0A9D4BCN1_DREPO|nr:hypothetical protein DPMN_191078 [Dreissena polymorpha]
MEIRVGHRCLKIYDKIKGFLLEYRVDAVLSSYKGMDLAVDWVKCEIAQQLKTETNSIYEAKLLSASVTDDKMVLSFSVLTESNELIDMQNAFSRFHENMNSYNLNKRHLSLRAGRSPYATIIAGKSLYIEYSPPRSGGACIGPTDCDFIRPRRFAMAEIHFCKGFLFDNFKTDASNNAAIIYNMTFLEHEFAYKIDEAKVKRVFMCQNTFFDKLNEANVFESRNAGMTIGFVGITLGLAVRLGVAILSNMFFNLFI